jgi:hypothetical protein
MSAVGFRGLAMAGGIAFGMLLATGAFYSARFVVDAVLAMKTARGAR